ncbi:MAG TPA: hypothetical protein VGA67_00090, partial [Candidatus Dojkabacteria bacterium]
MSIAILIFLFSLIPGIIGGYFIYKEKNKFLGSILVLIAIIANLLGLASDFYSQQKFNRLEKYSQIARMGPQGSAIIAGRSLSFTSGLAGDLDGTYIFEDKKFTYICSEESVSKMMRITEDYPDFPFSFFGIATCMKDKGKPGWVEYAEKAIEIFDETTKIKDH